MLIIIIWPTKATCSQILPAPAEAAAVILAAECHLLEQPDLRRRPGRAEELAPPGPDAVAQILHGASWTIQSPHNLPPPIKPEEPKMRYFDLFLMIIEHFFLNFILILLNLEINH